MPTVSLTPTYSGYVGSTKDALLVIEAVLSGQLQAVPRRPHDRERPQLISSGNVFVFIEERSGIRRWTDGVPWSPSRILGRFLVYRELDKSALSAKEARGRGADKNQKKTPKRRSVGEYADFPPFTSTSSAGSVGSVGSAGSAGSVGAAPSTFSAQSNNGSDNTMATTASRDDPALQEHASLNSALSANRQLVGSLITSYAFREYGLIKKTLSLTVHRLDPQSHQPVIETIHLVSYYAAEDVMAGKFSRPVDDPALKDLQLSTELWAAVKETSLGGKVPMEDEAFYFMDQTNPNAAMLGFTPALQMAHMSHMAQQAPAPTASASDSVPLTHHLRHNDQQHHHHTDALQPTQQPHSQFQQSGIPFGSFSGFGVQQFAPLPAPASSSSHHTGGHTASFSLPPPVSHHHTSSMGSINGNGESSASSSFINDLNLSMYQPRYSQQYIPQQQPGYTQYTMHQLGTTPNATSSSSTSHPPHTIARASSPESPTRASKELPTSTSSTNYGASSSSTSSAYPTLNTFPRNTNNSDTHQHHHQQQLLGLSIGMSMGPPGSAPNGGGNAHQKWGYEDQNTTSTQGSQGFVGGFPGQFGAPH